MKTKILIGVTCYSGKKYIIDRFITSIRQLDFKTLDVVVDIVFVDNSTGNEYKAYIESKGFKVISSRSDLETSQERLTIAYNKLREFFLDNNYTHLLNIEQDVLVPPETLKKLLKHNKDVVSGLYFLGSKPCVMVGKRVETPANKLREFRFEKYHFKYDFIAQDELRVKQEKGNLFKVFCAGLGCMLIKRNVIEQIKFKVLHNGDLYKGHCDMYWSMDLRQRGIDIWLDPNLLCEHDNPNHI